MPSAFDKNLLPEFDSIKDNDETIIWIEKPKFIPFLLSGLAGFIFLVPFAAIWFFMWRKAQPQNNGFFGEWFILIPIVFTLFAFLRKLFSYSNTCYAYSNKRVMMRTGFIGTDFKIIDYDKISDVQVTVNIIERIYQVGSIKFFSGRTETDDGNTKKLYDTWEAIPNPYEVFKRVKEVMVDIKTDYNYPNALRPDTNPGYNTRYEKKA
jgi:membrane protein YdbS with pleckstrin-like domain